MDLLSDRVGAIAAPARSKNSSSLAAMLGHLGDILLSASSAPLLISCLRAIGALAPSAPPEEESALTKLVPCILNFEKMKNVLSEALLTLNTLM